MEITEKRLREELVLTQQDIAGIAKTVEEMLTYQATMELMAAIAEEGPIRESEQAGLAPIDRIGWMVRNAYKLGYMTATVTLSETLEAIVADLVGGGTKQVTFILYRLIQSLVERERGLVV